MALTKARLLKHGFPVHGDREIDDITPTNLEKKTVSLEIFNVA